MPALGGRQPAFFQYRDHSREVKTFRVYTGEITAISLPGLLTELGDLATALDAVTLGTRSKQGWGEETVVSNDWPADEQAQVETEILVRMRGATSEAPWSFRIPTADYSAFFWGDPPSDQAVLTGASATAATTALIAALEATVKNPTDETEAMEVVGIEVVR